MQDKETARLKKQNRRLERKMKGLCVRCAAPNDNPTSYLCKACSEKERLERIRHKEKYKAEGKCLDCGKPVEIIGESRCSACKQKVNERRRKNYSDLKDLRICTRCGQQRAVNGKTKCWDCLEKDAEMSVKYREGLSKERLEERRGSVRVAMKKRRIKAREDGICVVCLQRRSVKGKSMCFDCIARQKRREADIKIILGTQSYDDCLLTGTCTRCHARPMSHGYVCEECYEALMKNLGHAIASDAYLRNKRIIRASISAGFALNKAYKR